MSECVDSSPDPWLTVDEAAGRAKVSTATIRREIRAGRLRAVRVGGRRCLRLRPQYVDQWLVAGSPEHAEREAERSGRWA